MIAFSVEEITVINNYHCADRAACINALSETLPFYRQPDYEKVGELVEGAVNKLNRITDEQYHNLDLSLAIELEDFED